VTSQEWEQPPVASEQPAVYPTTPTPYQTPSVPVQQPTQANANQMSPYTWSAQQQRPVAANAVPTANDVPTTAEFWLRQIAWLVWIAYVASGVVFHTWRWAWLPAVIITVVAPVLAADLKRRRKLRALQSQQQQPPQALPPSDLR
jgi:Flp pilus assembly protein TadB